MLICHRSDFYKKYPYFWFVPGLIWLETTTNMRKLIIPLLFSLFLITGCENNDFLQSESTVNSKLNGRWKRYLSSSTDPNQYWKMENGNLTIITRINEEDSIVDHGHYTVLTKISKCYITISDLSSPALLPGDMNTRWNISELTGSVFYITTTNQSGSVISREFVKQ